MDAAARSGEFDPGCRACRGGIDRLFAARQQRSAPARSQPSAKESRESRLVTGLPPSTLVWLDGTLAQYAALNEEALVL
jgi:hypothetical protein